MERTQITYQCISFIQLDTYTNVKGHKRLVEFRGGTINPRINGKYQTSDPELIKSLDADIERAGVKASFKCIHEEVLLSDDVSKSTGDIKEVPEITSVTKAKAWLLEASANGIITKGITPSMLPNRTSVLEIAAANNINFTDLPKE
jgi:hypothetical protein